MAYAAVSRDQLLALIAEHMSAVPGRALFCVVVSDQALDWSSLDVPKEVLRLEDSGEGREAVRALNASRDLLGRAVALVAVEVRSKDDMPLLRRLAPDLASWVDLTVEVLEEGRDTAGREERAGYDVYLAYEAGDGALARSLADSLARVAPQLRVFLDQRELRPGDAWVREIPRALDASRVVAVLIPDGPEDSAFYLHHDVATAIARARDPNATVRVVPVTRHRRAALPLALRTTVGLNLQDLGADGVARRLAEVADRTAAPRAAPPDRRAPDREALWRRLTSLLPSQFELLILHVPAAAPEVRSAASPLGARALDLVLWAEGSGALDELDRASRRLASGA